MRNTFGNIFTLTTFGESHGAAIGGVVDGMPAGIPIDQDFIQQELNRRRPGQSAITTSRKEADKVELLSGVFEGLSTGTPIGFIVRNENQHSQDYENMRRLFRPSHADTPIFINTVRATTGAAGARRPASPSAGAWPEHWPSWYCANWASACRPTPNRWAP